MRIKITFIVSFVLPFDIHFLFLQRYSGIKYMRIRIMFIASFVLHFNIE